MNTSTNETNSGTGIDYFHDDAFRLHEDAKCESGGYVNGRRFFRVKGGRLFDTSSQPIVPSPGPHLFSAPDLGFRREVLLRLASLSSGLARLNNPEQNQVESLLRDLISNQQDQILLLTAIKWLLAALVLTLVVAPIIVVMAR